MIQFIKDLFARRRLEDLHARKIQPFWDVVGASGETTASTDDFLVAFEQVASDIEITRAFETFVRLGMPDPVDRVFTRAVSSVPKDGLVRVAQIIAHSPVSNEIIQRTPFIASAYLGITIRDSDPTQSAAILRAFDETTAYSDYLTHPEYQHASVGDFMMIVDGMEPGAAIALLQSSSSFSAAKAKIPEFYARFEEACPDLLPALN